MLLQSLRDKLMHYSDAQFPIIYIHTYEERKCDEIIAEAFPGRYIVEWNASDGIVDFVNKEQQGDGFQTLERSLDGLQSNGMLDNSVLILKDVHHFIQEARTVSILKSLALKSSFYSMTLIMVSPVLTIPTELEKYITVIEMDYLEEADIRKTILLFIEEQELPTIEAEFLEEMTVAFKGLSQYEIRNILALAFSDGGFITRDDLRLIVEQKHQIIKKSGILELVQADESFDDVGGLEQLRHWLSSKAYILKHLNKAMQFGVDMPKGVLIAGMPGCGKSLTAKAASNVFGVPLLRLDMGRLLGKYVGESEANMRKAIRLAEAISPCVLWIDELEKAFAGIGGGSGGGEVATRLFGNFLTWMQEKKHPAFVVATANDILQLPPELLRKGRFDETFYAGFPNEPERKEILRIHISKRRKADLSNIDLARVAAKTNGYSGADLESIVKESVETVFAGGKECLTTGDLLHAVENTKPLSELMKDKIEILSKKYKELNFKSASR